MNALTATKEHNASQLIEDATATPNDEILRVLNVAAPRIERKSLPDRRNRIPAVSFDWAVISDPGNAADVHQEGYGGVNYRYRIGKHEVTNSQYTEFLDAVADDDPNGLYTPAMGSASQGGIIRIGAPGAYSYGFTGVSVSIVGGICIGPGGAEACSQGRKDRFRPPATTAAIPVESITQPAPVHPTIAQLPAATGRY